MTRLAVAALLLLLALPAVAAPLDLEVRSAEYRSLRQVRGHFQGGEWNDDVDAWKGRKHVVMGDLGEALGQPGVPVERVLALMGPPDQRLEEPGESTPEDDRSLWRMAAPTSGSDLLVYEWRGHHDFLYFWAREGKVVRSGWWMALE